MHGPAIKKGFWRAAAARGETGASNYGPYPGSKG